MIRSILLVAAIVSLAEGAALVRFINTVPTRTNQLSQSGTPANANLIATSTTAAPLTRALPNGAGGVQGQSDRVGLQYFAQSADGTSTAAPTLVWTTAVNTDVSGSTGATAPYAWYFAMPALRAYHSIAFGATPYSETTAVDKPFGARQSTDNNGQDPAVYDNYEQTRLRADGVGLYMQFAAGTYRLQAYAAISGDDTLATRNAAVARAFQDSSVQFTFADNTVYTIIAYGAGQFGASVALSGNTVRLVLLTEDTTPVTFGMASVRFFNGFAAAGVAVDVYSGTGVSDAARIASSIAVGSVSSYIDVAPGVQKEFPVAQTGSTANYLASSTAVQRDVRAGSRTTIICAINNEQTSSGFCRGFPSRVVAYVRLVNDLTSQDSLVQGAFGAQKLSQTRLSLWASYEAVRPEITVEGSQLQGTNKVTGHPLTQEGLYPVLVNVAPGTITGYSEVYVPLYIMDMAVRPQIAAPNSFPMAVAPATAPAPTTTELNYPNGGFIFSPIYKRVHYVIKTDGYATLSARQNADANQLYEYPLVAPQQTTKLGTAPATDYSLESPASFFTTDEYVEAGEYYSVMLSAGNLAIPVTVYAYPRSDILTVYYRRDRTVDAVSAGLTTGKGSLNLIAFPFQTWTGATFSLQTGATTTTAAMATVGSVTSVAAATSPYYGTTPYPSATANEIQLTAGTYTYSAGAGTNCVNTIPTATTPITIADQGIYDIFVLNVLGCGINGPSVSRLNFVVQQRAAVTSDNAPVTSRRHPVAAKL